MKETGIIFSTPMVQALQRGKAVTRRTRGLEEINKEPDKWVLSKEQPIIRIDGIIHYVFKHTDRPLVVFIKCPYGGKGDLLRVKETWMAGKSYDSLKPSEIPLASSLWYYADGKHHVDKVIEGAGKIRPSIFMPRELSRYFLPLIADPIPERVQSITEAEAIAEGIAKVGCITADEVKQRGWNAGDLYGLQDWLKYDIFSYTAKDAFARLWDELNQARGYSWKFNPWCWPLRFKPLTGGNKQ